MVVKLLARTFVAFVHHTYQSLQPMLTYSGCGVGAAEAENGSPAGSLLSGEGEEAGDSPGTSRDTEEEATLSDEFYSHDTDEEEEHSKRRRDCSSSVSRIQNHSPLFTQKERLKNLKIWIWTSENNFVRP